MVDVGAEPLDLDAFTRYLAGVLQRSMDLDPLGDLFADCGFDSIDTLELLVAIEDLGVEVDAAGFARCRSLFEFHQEYAGRASELASRGALCPAVRQRLEDPTLSRDIRPASPRGAAGAGGMAQEGFADTEHLFTGRMLRMRPAAPSDAPLLARLTLGHGLALGGRDQAIPPDQLLVELTREALLFLVLEDVEDGRAVGQVIAYRPDLRNGHVKLGVAVTPEDERRGVGVEGILLLARYVFSTWSFRKIYLELPDFVFARLSSRVRRYAAVEGQLRDHVFLNGCFRDLYIVALDRGSVENLSELVLSPAGGPGR